MPVTHDLSTIHSQNHPEPKPLPQILLASSSVFRKQLLEKLHLNFSQEAPDIDETPLPGETPKKMVKRLTLAKAKALKSKHPEKIIIASDQTACFDNQSIGKPQTFERAKTQLKSFSGKEIIFYTGLAVLDPFTGKTYEAMDTTLVRFRALSDEVIENYLQIEQPLNCAGSFKSEGLGISLFESIESTDPNALIGLPLIKLTSIFYQMGFALPMKPSTT